jgi:NitT/TauT family transport system ATP-binding protein
VAGRPRQQLGEATTTPNKPTSAAPVISLRGIRKTYYTKDTAVEAVQSVDLDIHAGQFVSFVGPSGCGKSTLLGLMSALLEPTEGEVLFEGRPLVGPSRDIGIMFQSAVLLPWRTVEKNILLPAEVGRADIGEARKKARELLDKVGLGEFRKAYPHQLSGGMQQRTSLARVLATSPKVLLMDEPFGALDEFTREAMNLELLRITEGTDVVVGFVTHNISEAVFLADRVVVMSPRPGRVSGVVDVDLPRPRTIASMHEREFTDLVFDVRAILGRHDEH